MKIISLNALGGTFFGPFMEFVAREAPTTDVFCFQEIYSGAHRVLSKGEQAGLFDILTGALPAFAGAFAPTSRVAEGVDAGTALFVRHSIGGEFQPDRFIVGQYNNVVPSEDGRDNWPVALQSVHAGGLFIAHLHGVAYPGHKLDTPTRLEQSDAIAQVVRAAGMPAVVCGDLNLMPGTESLARIEAAGMRNLVAEYGIERTRPQSHLLRYPPQERQLFADYLFASPGIVVRSFEVPEIEVSDHLPLVLDIS